MLPYTEHGSGPITLILMPFLGGSQREWTETVETLAKNSRCITLDLPGFGEAASVPGYSVTEMADAVLEVLSHLNLERYVLLGHSMSGKIVAVIARRIADGSTPLPPPTGLILVAPSPPCPEPMTDSKREEMLEAFSVQPIATVEDDRKHAEEYIKDNVSRVIPRSVLDRSMEDVISMNRAAWAAWLVSGSKEDWSDRIGMIDLPTLLLAGDNDNSLGPAAQKKHTQPHFPASHLISIDSGHLIPLEVPDEFAAMVSNFLKVF